MAVRWQNIEMPLGGADQYTDAPHVLPGKMRELENVRFRRPPTCSKRFGYEVLGMGLLDSASSIDQGVRLHGHRKETVLCDARFLYTYAKTANEWATRGGLAHCFAERRVAWSDFGDMLSWDGAYNTNILVLASAGGGTGNNVVVIDTQTDTVVNIQGLNTGGDNVRVVAVGNYVYIVQSNTYSRIDVTSGTYEFAAMSTFTGVSNVSGTPFLDLCPLSSTHLVMAYHNSSTNQVNVHRIAVSNNTSDANNTFAEQPQNTIAVHATTNEGVLAVWDRTSDGALRAWSLSTALVQVLAPATVATGGVYHHASIGRIDSDDRLVVWLEEDTTPEHDFTSYRLFDLAAGVGGSADTVPDVLPVSKPFSHDGRVYGWVAYASSGGLAASGGNVTSGGDQETFYLLEYTNDAGDPNDSAVWVATAARGLAERPVKEDNFLPLVSDLGNFHYECPQFIKNRFMFAGDADEPIITAHSRVERLRADFDESARLHMAAPWGGGLLIAGGRPSWYDGNTCTELGPAWRPEYFEVTTPIAGSLTAGDYDVALVYEWQDALGNIHRSAPSKTITVTAALNDQIDIDLDETLLSNKGVATIPTVGNFAAWRCFAYRSIVGPGPALYRSGTSTQLAIGVAAQRGQSLQLGVLAGDNDAAIQLRDLLYTTGGILENAGVPPCKYVVAHSERLWLGGLEEPELLWFSQPYVYGEGPRFHEQLSLRMPFEVTAIASMDAKLIAFGSDGIAAAEGQGPPATGGLDVGFVTYEVPTDVGCIEWRSVVVYRDGVLFQSRKGIYRLGRDLSVTFVGAAMKGIMDDVLFVTSAVDLPERSEVVFGVINESLASKRLVWNYELDEWSVDTCQELELSAAIVYNATTDKYVYAYVAFTDGQVFREKADDFNDRDTNGNAAFITSKWVTPWLKLSTLQDWLRVKGVTLLGTRPGGSSSCGLRVRVGFNYEDTTWAETHTFTAAELNSCVVNGRLQVDIPFGTMRCEAVRLEIIDTAPAEGGSAGIELQSLVFTGGFQASDRFRNVDRETARK